MNVRELLNKIYKIKTREVDSAQFFRQMGVAEEHLKHYDFPAPKGFEDRWKVSEMLGQSFDYIIIDDLVGGKEIPQCPRCEIYTDDPEHWCGSVALVPWKDTPWFSTVV